jgi:outer membrane protein OmpA-like peptidoglycan-associated protein
MKKSMSLVGASALLMVAALATTGCASKQYVRQQTTPIQQRVEAIDQKQTQAVSQLDGKEQKDISRVEERAMGAENKANDAERAAQAADSKAAQAAQAAQSASQLAQQNQTKLADVSRAVENFDNYKLATSEDVLFGFNKTELTQDGRAKLDQLIQQASAMPRYAIEVEGYTDKAGSKDYNLALSHRRADAVTRYLVDHGVPLRRVHMIGLGEQQPEAAANQTEQRLTAKARRRVVVRLFAPETAATANASPQQQ